MYIFSISLTPLEEVTFLKKLISILTISFIIVNLFPNILKVIAKEPTTFADSVVLMNATTGEILYSKNPDTAYPPASTTKVLTTLLTLENCKMTDIVTVSQQAASTEGSSIYLIAGEQITVEDLLYGLNLQSGNDCAVALAEHIGGSIENFSKMMNTRAKELGCTSSNFANPSGLYNINHKASAKDIALILKELVKHPEYYKIASTAKHVIKATNKNSNERIIWNKNKLVLPGSEYYYQYAKAGKTGYTKQSQYSYVAVAEKDGETLISVLIHDSSGSFYKDTINLFNYGFSNFKTKTLFKKGDVLFQCTLLDNSTLPLVSEKAFHYTYNVNTPTECTYKLDYDLERLNSTSIKKGDVVGKVILIRNSNVIGSIKLLSGVDHKPVKNASTILTLDSNPSNFFKSSTLFLFYLLRCINYFYTDKTFEKAY